MAEHCNLYDKASYYDIIFNRDVSKELDFVSSVYRMQTGKELKSVLDIACGPGYHARAFAKQGVNAFGLDLRAEMLRFANDEAKKDQVEVDWLEADMRTFQLASPVDVAFCMFDGLDCLLLNTDIVQHLRAVAANLTSQGIYIIDLSHARDTTYSHYKKWFYSGQRDQVKVEIQWAINDPQYNPVTGVATVEVEMRVDDNGRQFSIQDTANERLFYPQEINLLTELSGAFDVLGWYGDFSLSQPLDMSEKSQHMIAVLGKKS